MSILSNVIGSILQRQKGMASPAAPVPSVEGTTLPDASTSALRSIVSLRNSGARDRARSLMESELKAVEDPTYADQLAEHYVHVVAEQEDYLNGVRFLQQLNLQQIGSGKLFFVVGWLLASISRHSESRQYFDSGIALSKALGEKKDYACSNVSLPISLPPFRNGLMREMLSGAWQYSTLSDKHFERETGSLLNTVRNIALEISNVCQYSNIHPRCPLHDTQEKLFLATEAVLAVVDELAAIGFAGQLHWGSYTEPLIDPRLTRFVEYARAKCPQATQALTTSGYNLTASLADELARSGINQIVVSAYSMQEYIRCLSLPMPVGYCVYNSKLEPRGQSNVYVNARRNLPMKCYPFVLNLVVTVKGMVGLCCYDFNRRNTFGSIYENSLSALLRQEKLLHVHQQLAAGDRSILDECSRCDRAFASSPYWLFA